jgi:alpha-tubulin suppressor-like RCC1 family protein
MAWTKSKMAVAVTVVTLLVVGTVSLVTVTLREDSQNRISSKKLRLPLGRVTPAIGLGGTHGVILASEGSLWAWGEDANGFAVMGLGRIKKQTSPRQIGHDTNWVSIAVGMHHNLAIKSDGTLWGWGDNHNGQLGNGIGGPGRDRWSTPIASVPGTDWKQAAVGGSHSLALKKDGTLWAWGNNWSGQLGIGSTDQEVPDAVQVGSATNWVKVWAGMLETVALQSDGSLWYWGDNPNPELPQDAAHAIGVPMRVSPDTNWVDIGFGPWTALAIKSDGTLWAWGRFAHQFTGVREHALNATPMRVGTDSDWKTISPFGSSYRLLEKKDGSLWEMRNKSSPSTKPLQLTRIDLNKHWVAFNGNGRVPLGAIITDDGEVWTWGRVLGENTPEHKTLQSLARLLRQVHVHVDWGDSQPMIRTTPWVLPVSDDLQKE